MNKKKLYIGLGSIIVVFVPTFFIANALWGGSEYDTFVAERELMTEEISANGNIEAPSKINLYFKSAGELASLSVEAGSRVEKGDTLAVQDTSALDARIDQYEASIDGAYAGRDKLLEGASEEDVALAETKLANAEEDLLVSIEEAYMQADNAVRKSADKLFENPDTSPSFGVQFIYSGTNYNINASDVRTRTSISSARKEVGKALANWPSVTGVVSPSVLEDAATVRGYLLTIRGMLDEIARVVNSYAASDTNADLVYEGFKSEISTARQNIETVLDSLISLHAALEMAQSELVRITAPARSSDVALRDAEVRQAEAVLRESEALIRDAVLTAPISGIVTDTNGARGEIVGPETTIVTLIPNGALEVRVNVSENNIINVNLGQTARVTLDAFGTREWSGTVIHIDPAETVIGGAIYYSTTVLLDDPDARMRPGMTANVWIQTASKEDAIVVPISAVREEEGKFFIQVLEGDSVEEREVEVGLASGGRVEVTSGLSEGEEVILGKRSE